MQRFGDKREDKRPLVSSRHTWNNNIRTDLKETALDSHKWQVLAGTVMNLQEFH
jgi:hypothetical protein